MSPKSKSEIYAEEKAWAVHPSNNILLIFLLVMLGLIMTLFTPYTNNLDEIKPTLQFMFLPLGILGFFIILARGESARIPTKIWAPLLAFFVVMFVSSLFARYKWRAWFTFGWYWSAIAPFLIVISCMKTRDVLRWFVSAYVWMGLAIVLFGLFHYARGFTWLLEEMFYRQPDPARQPFMKRIYDLVYTMHKQPQMFATFLNTDFYGAYLVLLFPISLSMLLAPFRRWWEPVLGGVTAFLAGLSVVFTESNDSQGVIFLALVFCLGMAFLTGHTLSKKHNVMWAIIGAFVVLVFVAARLYWYELGPQIESLGMAFDSRGIIYAGGWKMFLDHPVIGAGPGAFYLLFPLYRAPNYFENEISNVTLYAHNMYLGLLAEEGLLGFISFMALLIVALYLAVRLIFRTNDEYLRTYQIGFMAAIIAVSIQNAFSPNARWTVCAVNFWTVLGLSVASSMIGMRAERQSKEETDDEPASGPPPSPQWKRDFAEAGVGFYAVRTAIVVSALVALTLFTFGYRRFACAYRNNQGIIWITTAEHYGALARANTSPQSALAKAQFAESLKYYNQAVEDFDKAIRWWPGFITSYYKQAHAYSMLGKQNKALEAYEALSKFAEDYSEIHYNYGIIYSALAGQSKSRKDRIQNLGQRLLALAPPEGTGVLSAQAEIQREQLLLAVESVKEECVQSAQARIEQEEPLSGLAKIEQEELLPALAATDIPRIQTALVKVEQEQLLLALEAFEKAGRSAHKPRVQSALANMYHRCWLRLPDDPKREEWKKSAAEVLYQACMRENPLRVYRDDQKMIRQRAIIAPATYPNIYTYAIEAYQAKDAELHRQYLSWTIDVCRKLIDENLIEDDAVVTRLFTSMRSVGRHEEAEKYLREKINENPLKLIYHHALANHLRETARHAAAAEQYELIFNLLTTIGNAKFSLPGSKAMLASINSRGKQMTPEAALALAADAAHSGGDTATAKAYLERLKACSPQAKEIPFIEQRLSAPPVPPKVGAAMVPPAGTPVIRSVPAGAQP